MPHIILTPSLILQEENDCDWRTLTIESGHVTLECFTEENTNPNLAVAALYDLDRFDNILYTGFELEEAGVTNEINGAEATVNGYTFNVEFELRPNEVEWAEEEAPEETSDEAVEE